MSAAAVRRLDEVRLSDAAEVGGKAASLGELIAAGFDVPAGVVLDVGTDDERPPDRRSLLRGAAHALGGGPFAVRSSGIAEDGAEHSFAGIYESVLDVPAHELPSAVDRVLASAHGPRASGYEPAGGAVAVIVQRMVRASAAGVALTADPVSGDRGSCVVTAVHGGAERLVSGQAFGDEWVVKDGKVAARRQPDRALDGRQVAQVAVAAMRIARERGQPQDIEWALDEDGALWILQARPMTALPPDASWDPPACGAYTRTLRLGEWISQPVTPLFESWLLTILEERLHDNLRQWIGQRAPQPLHVVVNGWYFYSLDWLAASNFARSLPSMLACLVRSPRRMAGVLPPTARHSVPVFEQEWRDDVRPRYRAAVEKGEGQSESLSISQLPQLIDALAAQAGDYFASIAALGGSAYKLEINLARFYRRHLSGSLGGSHLPLLAGLVPPSDPAPHAVATLDWWHAPSPSGATATTSTTEHDRLAEARTIAEDEAFKVLSSSPRKSKAFRRLLADAQHMVPIREEQARELTLAWPVMRRAIGRIGDAFAADGVIAAADDVYFMTRAEVREALTRTSAVGFVDVSMRRSEHAAQARLTPPLVIGRVGRPIRRFWDDYPRAVGAVPSERALVSGTPASPGRASGPTRVILGPEDFDDLQPGEVLVAPLTAPAWTPLFTRAVAVVTDVGSPAAHASTIAREYGIPAVVGCGDATARLRTGMRVTVDGSTGNVEPGHPSPAR